MKTAVIYYSMSGNTALVAKMLAARLDGDLICIRPEQTYPDRGLKKYLWGGKSAVMADSPRLEPYSFEAARYDRIVFGFPVWASTFAPPLRTFVRENSKSLQSKDIAVFACMSGSGGTKAIRRFAKCLGRDSLSAEMVLIDPKDRPNPENDRKIAAFLS